MHSFVVEDGSGAVDRRPWLPIILGALAVAAVSATIYIGTGYLDYLTVARNERLAAERAESANADLLNALFHMGDELVTAQAQIDAMSQQLAAADAQMRAGNELERQLTAYEEAMARRTATSGRRPPHFRKAPLGRARLQQVRTAPATLQPSLDISSGSPAAAAVPSQFKNFAAPGWVPDYFASESAPFLGSTIH